MSGTQQRAKAPGPSVETGQPTSRFSQRRPFEVQAKLHVSAPGDRYEQEADRVAEQVMRMPASALVEPAGIGASTGLYNVLRACKECEDELQRDALENDDTLRYATLEEEEEEELQMVQAKGNPAMTVSPGVQQRISSLRGAGRPLPDCARLFFEPRFGFDFGRVRVHTGGRAADTARALNARAFTYGRHIVFGNGQYAPHSESGRRLLAHELTHTIQQGQIQRRYGHPATQKPRIQRAPLGLQRAVSYGGALVQHDINPLDPSTAPAGNTSALGHTAFEVGGTDIKNLTPARRLQALFPLPSAAPVSGLCFMLNRTLNVPVRSRVRVLTPAPWTRTVAKSRLGTLFGGVLGGNASCSGTGNVAVTLTGTPNDLALRAWSLHAELQHARDDRCLVDRYLKGYESDVNALPSQFPRGYLGFGSCDSRLDERLKRTQRYNAFVRDYAAFGRDYDRASGSHFARASVNVGTGCNTVTLTIRTGPLPAQARTCTHWSPP